MYMITRRAIYVVLLIFSSQVFSAEFPTGTFKGVGFLVEKGNIKLTEKDLYSYNSSATVRKRSENMYKLTLTAHLQKFAHTQKKTEKREDICEVIWDTPNTGRLVNKNAVYKKDRTNFIITEDTLVLKSWIHRNQLWETQIYSLAE